MSRSARRASTTPPRRITHNPSLPRNGVHDRSLKKSSMYLNGTSWTRFWCSLIKRLCADPAIYVIDEGTASMMSHRSTPHSAMHGRSMPVQKAARTQKRSMSRTARWIIILLTVSGSIAPGMVATAFASSHQPTHSTHQRASTPKSETDRAISRPWMY